VVSRLDRFGRSLLNGLAGIRPAPHGRDAGADGGVPVHIVAARPGDPPEQVLSTYSQLLPSSHELAADRIAAVLRPAA
jgi:hypothetical protein